MRLLALGSLGLVAACFVDHDSKLPADFAICEAAPPAAAPAGALTYYQHAKPIIDAKCTGCHQDGGIAPFPLTTYEEVAESWQAVHDAVSKGRMPPWPASPCCNHYRYDPSLTAPEKETLLAWLMQGVVPGDPADEGPPIAHDAGGISRIDLRLQMPEPFEPEARIGADELRCFLLDHVFDEDTFFSGMNVEPGNRNYVHHVVVFRVDADDTDELRALDARDERPGWDCYGELGARPEGVVGGWQPGFAGFEFPPGVGGKIPAGSQLVLNVHYDTGTPGGGPDQTAVELMLTDAIEREAQGGAILNPLWLAGEGLRIPAGEPDVMYSFAYEPTTLLSRGEPFEILQANLHMHELGSHGSIAVLRADGTVDCVLDVPAFDFDWSGMYWLKEPVRVEPGDKLYVECHFDNTAENQKIVNGERQVPRDLAWGADDEMCAGVLTIVRPEDA